MYELVKGLKGVEIVADDWTDPYVNQKHIQAICMLSIGILFCYEIWIVYYIYSNVCIRQQQ